MHFKSIVSDSPTTSIWRDHDELPPLPQNTPEADAFFASSLSPASAANYIMLTEADVGATSSVSSSPSTSPSSSASSPMDVYTHWTSDDVSKPSAPVGKPTPFFELSASFNTKFNTLSIRDFDVSSDVKPKKKPAEKPVEKGPVAERQVGNYERFDGPEDLNPPPPFKRENSLDLFLSGLSLKQQNLRLHSDAWNQSNHQEPLSVSPSALAEAKKKIAPCPVSENVHKGNYDYFDGDTRSSSLPPPPPLVRQDSLLQFLHEGSGTSTAAKIDRKRKIVNPAAHGLPTGRDSSF